MAKPKFKMKYNVRYIRTNGDDDDLIKKHQLFGTVGPWVTDAYYNNEVYRLRAEMNKICEKLVEKHAEHVKVIKKRNQLHRSIGDATFQPEGIGYVENDIVLPLFRKDKKPMENPPGTWLQFVRVIKHGGPAASTDLSTKVVLADDSAGSRDYPIQPRNGNNQNKQKRRGGAQQNDGQN
ncbi:MAG: hypothetical protein V3S69_05755 [Dehalococcoidales bacterium]